AAEDRIDLAGLRLRGEIDRVLIEVWSLASGPWRSLALTRVGRGCGSNLLRGLGGDLRELGPERVGGDLLQLLAHLAGEARQLLVGHERENRVPGAHLISAEVYGAKRPRFGEHLHQVWAQGWRARVPRFQLIEASRELRREARPIHAIMLHDE